MNPKAAAILAMLLSATLTIDTLVFPLLAMVLAICFLATALALALNYQRHRRSYRRALAAATGDGMVVGLPASPDQTGGDGGKEGVDDTQRRWKDGNAPDRSVLRALLLYGLPPILLGVWLTAHSQAPLGSWPELWVFLTPLGLLFGIWYVSTLIDWYWILPQISGIVRDPPCRPSSPVCGTARRGWGTVTRVWYAHRWGTAFLSMLASGATGFGLIWAVAHFLNGNADAILLAGISLPGALPGIAFFMRGIAKNLDAVTTLQQNLTAALGDLVVDENDLPTPRAILPRLLGAEQRRPPYYVVDVSMEFMKLKLVIDATRCVGEPFWPHKQSISIPTPVVASRVQPTRKGEVWNGCNAECSGVNWYCDNNVRPDRYGTSHH